MFASRLLAQALATVTVGALLLGAPLTAAAQQAPQQVTVLGGNSGGAWYSISVGLGNVLTQAGTRGSGGLGGGNTNIIAVAKGQAEAGLTLTVSAAMAASGEDPFPEKIDNVRGIASLWMNALQIGVAKESGVTSVDQLAGKPFALQPLSAATTTLFRAVLESYGLSESDLKEAANGGMSAASAAIQDRRAIGFHTMSTFPMAAVSEIAASVPLTILPVSDEAFEKMRTKSPGFSRVVVPAGTYKGQDMDAPTIGAATILIVSAEMSEDAAYWITKALVENIDAVRASNEGLKNLTVEQMADVQGIALHPGAARYYHEIGILK